VKRLGFSGFEGSCVMFALRDLTRGPSSSSRSRRYRPPQFEERCAIHSIVSIADRAIRASAVRSVARACTQTAPIVAIRCMVAQPLLLQQQQPTAAGPGNAPLPRTHQHITLDCIRLFNSRKNSLPAMRTSYHSTPAGGRRSVGAASTLRCQRALRLSFGRYETAAR